MESSWGTLNRFFGNENSETMKLYRRGGIDYAEFMRRDIEAWPKPLHLSQIREALSGWVLRPGAIAAVAALRDRGLDLAILTGGVGVLAEEVATELCISGPIANQLVTDERGFLTGEARMHVDPLRKELALERICRDRGVALHECVTIGDSEMDRSFLRAGGLGVLLGDAATGKALGVSSVTELSGLLDLVERGR